MKRSLTLLLAILTTTAAPTVAQIKLASPTPSADANFGFSVMVHQGLVYVGAPGASAGGIQRGEVLVFNAASGTQIGTVRDADLTDFARFGESLAIVGNRLFIGSPLRPGASYGRVYYLPLPVVGTQLAGNYIFAPDAASNEDFGAAIAGAFGNNLVVGAPSGPGGQNVGKVYAYSTVNNVPVLTEGPLTLGSTPLARLGAAVAGSDSVLAIGSPLDSSSGLFSGRLYLSTPGFAGVFMPPTLAAGSELGTSVAAFSTQVLAGAPNFEPDPSQNNLGTAFLIDTVGTPVVVRQFTPGTIFGRFGDAVALNATFAAIGAPFANSPTLEAGAFYLMPTVLPPRTQPVDFPIAPADLAFQDRFGDAISMDANFVAVSAPTHDTGGVDDAGAVYVYALAAPRPVAKPKPKTIIASGPRGKIAGRARGGFVAIARVESAAKRKGPYRTLRGTSRWTGQVKINRSTRKIFVRAFDAAGTSSKIVPLRVARK